MPGGVGGGGSRGFPLSRWYAEEAGGHPLAGRTVRTSDFGDAVENLCIVRASMVSKDFNDVVDTASPMKRGA